MIEIMTLDAYLESLHLESLFEPQFGCYSRACNMARALKTVYGDARFIDIFKITSLSEEMPYLLPKEIEVSFWTQHFVAWTLDEVWDPSLGKVVKTYDYLFEIFPKQDVILKPQRYDVKPYTPTKVTFIE